MWNDKQFELARRLALKLAGIELCERHRDLLEARSRRLGIQDEATLETLLREAGAGSPDAASRFIRLVTTGVSGEPIRADPVQMLFKQTRLIGSAHNDRADLVDMLHLVAARKVRPVIETYRMDEVNPVMERLAAGKVRYRAVLLAGP